MSSPTPSYPNLQTSFNQSQPSTPRLSSRMSMQSDGDFRDENEFVVVAEGDREQDDGTASALQSCEKWVLRPYRYLLLFLGWTDFGRGYKRVLRWIWVAAICFFIILTSLTQILSCFRRDRLDPHHKSSNSSIVSILCSNNLVSSYILLDLLVIISYLYGLYLFSKSETEYLLRLAENVFVKCYKFQRWPDPVPKFLIVTVFIYITGGISWIILSIFVRVLHAASYHLFSHHVHSEWESGPHLTHELKLALLGYSIFGFIFFDAVYVAAVVNHATQSEMNIYLLQSIKIRILSRKYSTTDEAIKDVKLASDHIRELNGKTATATALILFNLGASGVIAFMKLNDDNHQSGAQVVSSVFNMLLWSLLVLFPFVQAARVSSYCSKLLKTAPTIRARSLLYQESTTAELDSFIMYTSAIKMRAKMFGIPIYPWLMYSFLVVISFTMLVLFETGGYSVEGWF